jgi:hypothetical protein
MRLFCFAACACVLSASISHAQDAWTGWAQIREINSGWVEDTMAVFHAGPFVSLPCATVTNGGYATNPNDPGHSLFHTLLISALLNKKEVAMRLEGCVYGKPRITAVNLR